MSWKSPQEVLAAAEWQRQFFAAQLDQGRAAASQHKAALTATENEQAQAVHELGVSLLPTLHPAAIERAASITGLAALVHERLPEKVASQRADIRARIRAIEADRRYIDMEMLLHPRTGSLARAYGEMEGHLRACDQFLGACRHERLQRLLDAGYGTAAYKGGWWRLSSWRDDSAAKEIAARFPGRDFASVRAEYDRVLGARQRLMYEHGRLSQEIADVKELGATREKLLAEDRTLDQRWLAWARDRLVGHVLGTDPAAMTRWLEREPAMKLLFLRASGAKAKASYQRAIFDREVGAPMRDWEQRVAKYGAMIQQYRRRPKPMPADKFFKMFPDRRQKAQASWQRYHKTYGKVSGFNRYHAAGAVLGAGAVTYLWWDLMNDGRGGEYIPEVKDFRQHHPEYSYEKPPKDDEGAVDLGVAEDAPPDDGIDQRDDADGAGALESSAADGS